MTARIDHAAVAVELDEVAGEHLTADEFAYADMAFKGALVHATLALVEQQRVANLIALGIGSSSAQVREAVGLS